MSHFIHFYNQNKRKNNYLFFTILFFLTLCIIFSVFIIQNKSFIWIAGGSDGLDQHYTSLMYYGEYLRTLVKNILTHQDLPLWDFSIGYGADIITTFHYYVLGDPLTLLSIFVPMQYTEYLYTFLILIRYFLVGVSFIAYCHYMEKVSWSTFIGALTYTFCGFAIYAGIKHPYFLNPMIYLPIIFIGIEKIYQKKSPLLFISIVFISAISNFYFFYMLCIIMFIYASIRFFHYYHQDYIQNIIKKITQFIAYYLVGIGLSAIILVPVILMFFNTARSQDRPFIPFLYSIPYYIELFFGTISSHYGGYWTITGLSATTFLTTLMLFFSRKKNISFIISWILCVAFLSLPFFGVLFNGFSYISNRWCFVYAFLMSFILVECMPQLLTLTWKQYFLLGLAFLLEVVIVLLNKELQNYSLIFSLIVLVIILIILFFHLKNKINVYKTIIGICVCTLISIQVNAIYKYIGQNYSDEYLTQNQAYQDITQNYLKVLSKINDNDFYRYDKFVHSQRNLHNISVIQRKNPISFFFSLGNGYITEFFYEMKNVNILSSVYNGLDTRSTLLSLASVKYLITDKDQTTVPYGFEKMNTIHDKDYDVYYNQNYLPLCYTYNSQIERNEYNQLTSLEKQKVLLKSVLLEENVSLKKKNYNKLYNKIQIKIDDYKDIVRKGNKIYVKKKNASLHISYQLPFDEDVYISLSQLKLQQKYYAQTLSKAQIQIKDQHSQGNITIYSPYNSYYNGTKNYLKHIGYLKAGEHHLKVIFKNKGIYEIDDMQILGQSLDDSLQDIQKLKENILEDLKIETNCIKGNISLDQRKFLCFSIPYSSGWKAYVNGKEADLLRANTMYMGIVLDEGDYNIELRYQTPGLKLGSYISLGSVILLLMIVLKNKKSY